MRNLKEDYVPVVALEIVLFTIHLEVKESTVINTCSKSLNAQVVNIIFKPEVNTLGVVSSQIIYTSA